jgi:hypothetical protein
MDCCFLMTGQTEPKHIKENITYSKIMMCVCVYVCVYIYICVCVYLCVYVCVCMCVCSLRGLFCWN